MFEAIWQDLRYGVRSLARRPLVASVAVLSLALGIGVNTAIFSVFDRLLLRSLPVPAPERIVNITSPGPRPGSRSTSDAGQVDEIFSYPLFRDLEQLDQTGLTGLAAHRDFDANLAYRGQTSTGAGLLVSGRYFQTLGVQSALGRLLTPDDDAPSGAQPAAVLSHDYWKTRFGARTDVLNATLIVNGEPLTIVGVAEAGFSGTSTMERPQVYLPLGLAARLRLTDPTQRNNHWLYLFGRLKDGVTREQAQAMMNVPFAHIIEDVEFPALRSGMGDRDRKSFVTRRIILTDGERGRNRQRDATRFVLLLLFAVTGFVLLIACANVANLLLARASDRATEIAVRLSIGSSSGRIVRLLLIEACLLGLLGGLGAMAVSKATIAMLLSIMPADDRTLLAFDLNMRVFVFSVVLGVVTGVLFGLFPALHAVRARAGAGLTAQDARGSGSRAATRFRTTLATAQITLATVLLALAGMFLTSLVNISRTELGIDREGLVTFRLAPGVSGYTGPRALALYERVQGELRGLPGVSSVSASTVPLLGDSEWGNNVTVEGFEPPPGVEDASKAMHARIGADYFRTVGIPLVAGREFTAADLDSSHKVAVVNEAFARKFHLRSRVIGAHMMTGASDTPRLDIEIVGLVRDAKYSQVKEPPPPQFFMPYRDADTYGLTFYVRARDDARAVLSAIPAIVAREDANLPIVNLRTMDEQIWDNTARDRVLTTLSSSFAGLATLLAAVGLYAVLAYSVARRIKEIGIRVALGARPLDIRRLVLMQVGRVTVVGGALGCLAAFALGRVAQRLLFGLDTFEPTVLAAAALTVIGAALAAAVGPAHRAASVHAIDALRAE